MTAASFALILTGVMLNAAAQLLLKAGTNTLGVITPTVANALPLAGTIATHPYFLSGFASRENRHITNCSIYFVRDAYFFINIC